MGGEGLKTQIHGLAHDEYVVDYHNEEIKFASKDNFNIFLGHDPHLICSSENGFGLLDLASADFFIAGHLHDGYKCVFKHIEALKKLLTGKGFKSLELDNGWVEQPSGVLDKDGNKIKRSLPSIYGKTDLCRGIIFFDDECQNKIWCSPDNKFYKDGNLIGENTARKIIKGNNLHFQLISEGGSPVVVYFEPYAVINVVDINPS